MISRCLEEVFYEEKNSDSFIELDWFVHVFDKPLENYVVCPLYNDSDVSKIQCILIFQIY